MIITNNTEDKKSITIQIDRSKYDALEAYFAMQDHTLGDFLMRSVDRKYGVVKAFAEKYFVCAVSSTPKSVPKKRPLPRKNPSQDNPAEKNISVVSSPDKTDDDTSSEGGDNDDSDGG